MPKAWCDMEGDNVKGPLFYLQFIERSQGVRTFNAFMGLCRDIRDAYGFSSVMCLTTEAAGTEHDVQLIVCAKHRLFKYLLENVTSLESRRRVLHQTVSDRGCNTVYRTQNHHPSMLYNWDPTLTGVHQQVTPVQWQTDQLTTTDDHNNRLFWQGARDCKIERFITVPVRDKNGNANFIRFNHTTDDPLTDHDIAHALPQLHLLSAHLYEAYKSIVSQRAQTAIHSLSTRQLDIIRFVASGHSTKSISDKLNISENTVLYHMKRIHAELGVTSRQHAVAKAMSMGIF